MAISFLRDEAADWLNNALAVLEYETWLTAQTSYVAFKKAFRLQFFSITATSDVSSDWSTLKQQKNEDAVQFGTRVAATIRKYVALLEDKPVEVRRGDVAELNTVVQPIRDLVTANAAPSTAQIMALDGGITSYTKKVRDTAFAIMSQDISVKVIGDGLATRHLREVVRAEERKGKSLAEILTALNAAERNMGARMETSFGQRQPNRMGGVSEINKEDSEQETPVAAADRGRGRGRGGRGRGRGRGGQDGGPRPSAPERPQANETRTCFFCKEVGHLKANCPKREAGSRQGAAALQDGRADQWNSHLPLTWQGNKEADV